MSEVLYAFSSGAGNNGSAFAGLGANTSFYNIALGLAMLIGRFWIILPTLAIAGSLAKKKLIPESAGTLRTDGPMFAGLLIGRDHRRRRAQLLPGPRPGTDRRTSA